MRFKTIPICLSLIAFATISLAQTKISGTVQCGKSDEQHALEVGDHPGHSLMISKGRCTWTKPMDIAGTQTKEDLGTNFDEVHGNKSQRARLRWRYYGQWRQDVRADTRLLDTEGQRGREC